VNEQPQRHESGVDYVLREEDDKTQWVLVKTEPSEVPEGCEDIAALCAAAPSQPEAVQVARGLAGIDCDHQWVSYGSYWVDPVWPYTYELFKCPACGCRKRLGWGVGYAYPSVCVWRPSSPAEQGDR
jgi:hypothetical protein